MTEQKWHYNEYLEYAGDPLADWPVPATPMGFVEARRVFLSALTKLREVHKILVEVPDLEHVHTYGGRSARKHMEAQVSEARQQIYIALAGLQRKDDEDGE